MKCKNCGRPITGSHETLFPDVHFHNTPTEPCLFEWLTRKLKIAVRKGKP
jgi:hypothetical protein